MEVGSELEWRVSEREHKLEAKNLTMPNPNLHKTEYFVYNYGSLQHLAKTTQKWHVMIIQAIDIALCPILRVLLFIEIAG